MQLRVQKFITDSLVKLESLSLKSILLSAFVFRLLWIIFFPVAPQSDYLWYFQRAVSIATGAGYAINGTPTAYWPIGYPLFLGCLLRLSWNNIAFPLFINVVLSTATIYFLYRVALSWGITEARAKGAAVFFAVYINQIAYTSLYCSEIPFMFFFLGALVFLSKTRQSRDWPFMFCSSVFFGAAILIKPILVFFPLVYVVLVYIKPLRIQSLLVHYIIILLILLPVTMRNYSLTHELFFVSLNSPVNLFIGNNPLANGTYRYDADVTALIGNPTDELTESKRAGEFAKDYILLHPGRVAMLLPVKVFYQYASDVDGLSSALAGIPVIDRATRCILKAARIYSQVLYIVTMLLFIIVGTVRIRLRGMQELLTHPAIVFVSYFFVMYLPFFGAPRFHFVMMPGIILFLAQYISGAPGRVKLPGV